MTGGSVTYYSFPDDHGQTLHQVISKLPPDELRGMTWRPTEHWLVEVPAPLSVALTAVLARVGVRRLDEAVQSGFVMVPAQARAAIQNALARRPHVLAVWSKIEGVEFANARSQEAFEGVLSEH